MSRVTQRIQHLLDKLPQEVWGKIIDKEGLEDHFSQFKKLIWNSQPMSVRHVGNQTPLTALWLTFGKIRMWIDENIDVCIDQQKLDSKKVKKCFFFSS